MIGVNGGELGNALVGNSEIQAIYVGDAEVWSNGGIIDLGTAQTFDVKSILETKGINIDTASLTEDNFFFSEITELKRTHRVGWVSGSHSASGLLTYKMEKTYSKSTGVLTFRGATTFITYFNNWGTQYTDVHAYLITKPTSLVSLGTSQAFDISSYGTNISNYLFSTFTDTKGETATVGAAQQDNKTAIYKFVAEITGSTLNAYALIDSDRSNGDGYGNVTAYYSKNGTDKAK